MFIGFSFFTHAQDTSKTMKIAVQLNAGAIFLNFEQNDVAPINTGKYNHWNTELYIEENKLGIGLIIRHIGDIRSINDGLGYIRNPFFKPAVGNGKKWNQLVEGDFLGSYQDFYGFSFLLNKRLFMFNKKHRIDFGIGTQRRTGYLYYFAGYLSFWEIYRDEVTLDKHGLLSRLGYTYLLSKHFSVSTNIEYSRFKMKPADFWDFNVLLGVRF